MTTTARSFVVFRDDTPSSPSKSRISDEEDASLVVTAVAPPHSGPALVFCPDKENINPLTGLRANTEQTAKKRKTGVLATKLHVPPPSKKVKESKDSKKRGTLSSSASVSKIRAAGEKKPKRAQASRRNGASSGRARRSPSLPRVAEETDMEKEREQERIAQAVVDARCYELTVMPLADLSKAYEQAPALDETHISTPEAVKGPEMEHKEQLVESAEGAPSPSSSPRRGALPSPVRSSPTLTQEGMAIFSTPERKRIYSAFTFSSPSSSGVRYATVRGSSVDQFSDPDFEPRL
ncbi:hypothetical protein AcV5_002583 [Taiwanofungus camphoratus]|nr:hypothetical protein AcV5_002583 [Antrodia cinnamomea]